MSEECLPVYDDPSNQLILMELFEEFHHFCRLNAIEFWLDWGSELGALRHGNIIPWDIDCDTCLIKDHYQKLLHLFEKNGNQIGNLTCDPLGYNDRNGCCWIYNSKYLYLGKDFFGIDVVSYEKEENQTKTLMSKEVTDRCPATPSSYDYENKELYPLRLIPFVGNFVSIPHKSLDLIQRFYGKEDYLKYPSQEYQNWLKFNCGKLFLLHCPFKTVTEVQSIKEGLQLNVPFVIRNCKEFDISIEKLKDSFVNEDTMSSWYETKEEIFNEHISKDCHQILKLWDENQMTTNITDSPWRNLEYLPQTLRERMNKLDPKYQHFVLSYVLTNENTLTKFHQDIGGGGWMFLKQGKKLWWFISPEDILYLQTNHYPIQSLRDLSFTQLVFLHQHYLWGKISILQLEENDFVLFPEHWAHRVFTYDKALGIGGYSR